MVQPFNTNASLGRILTGPVGLARDVRADRYGIGTFVRVDGVPIKLGIVSEGRIDISRGLLSPDNLADLQVITLPGDGKLEFILAVPGRRYNDFVDLLTPFHDATCADAKEEVLGEAQWDKLRLIIAHDPQVALAAGAKRDLIIESLEQKAAQWAGKLDGQEGGAGKRGRKLSDGGARARLYHEVCEAHLARIVRVDLKSELFTYSIDERAHACAADGRQTPAGHEHRRSGACRRRKRYKSLADIERGFRVLKSEIEIGPIYHRLPERIRAHAVICFMALILYRVMRTRLHASDTALSPERPWKSCVAFSTTASR